LKNARVSAPHSVLVWYAGSGLGVLRRSGTVTVPSGDSSGTRSAEAAYCWKMGVLLRVARAEYRQMVAESPCLLEAALVLCGISRFIGTPEK
jgi:hypothetical protein